MSDAVKSIQNTQINISSSIEDIYAFLLKLMDEKENFIKDKLFLNAMKEKGKYPVFLSMEHIAMKRLVKELDNNGIPYMQFDIAGTSKDILLIRPEDTARVKDVENGIRIQAGLEIDTKEELDRALAITEKEAKEIVIRGLSEYEATRIVQMSNKNPMFTVVLQEQTDGTYLVASHEKNSERMYEFAMTAITEGENNSAQMQEIKSASQYINQQKKEFLAAIDEIHDRGLTQEAYIFSLTTPEYYIHIKPASFEIVDRGMVTHAMELKDNPTLYPDALKFLGEDIDSPLFVLGSEIKEKGGSQQVIKEARERLGNGIIPRAYPDDVAFKKWLIDSLAVSTGSVFKNHEVMDYVNIDDFTEKSALADSKANAYRDQFARIKERINNISVSFEKPQLELEDIMEHEGLDPALLDRLYDEEEIRKIQNGEFQFTDGDIVNEERRLAEQAHSPLCDTETSQSVIADKSERERIFRERIRERQTRGKVGER